MIKKKKLFLVSVIVNCHNGEKYLKRCINSVINQTYKKFEIIFWDNCSTDKSLEIIKNFKDSRIKVFSSKIYKKLYSARNLAIKKAKGDIITFLDTDDLWEKNKLLNQYKTLIKKNNFTMIYSNYYKFYQSKKKKLLNLIRNYIQEK